MKDKRSFDFGGKEAPTANIYRIFSIFMTFRDKHETRLTFKLYKFHFSVLQKGERLSSIQ